MSGAFLANQVNQLMEKVNADVECDAECQNGRNVTMLYDAWKQAEREYNEGQARVDEKERIYLNKEVGTEEASKRLVAKFKAQIRLEIEKDVDEIRKTNKHNAENLEALRLVGRIRKALERLNGTLEIERKELSKAQRSTYANVQTNDQRVVYTEKALANVSMYYYVLLVGYFLLFFGYLWKGPFINQEAYTKWEGWVLPLAFFLIGCFSSNVVSLLMEIYNYIHWWVVNKGPSDVYLDLRS
tara:strand:+ start:7473 stop:8198 length:726 start_codon:yes stop_codon:yes gene_type:complete